MHASRLLLVAALPATIAAQETVLGAYIFHRHGDRTSKSYAPVNLTDLGYSQVYAAGQFFRARYLDGSSSLKIRGINQDVVALSQLNVEAPVDNVLQNSAQGWLQGLYPPVGSSLSTQTLANGSSVSAPLDGYQLIPVNAVASASSSANSENSAWLQGSSGCANAVASSNNYFNSAEYLATLDATRAFYASLLPVVNSTFSAATDTFKNAYTIYDYVHVSSIHNDSASIPAHELLSNDTLLQLRTRADQHEFGLAYNSSDPIRAIAGSTLAAQIVQALNTTIAGRSASKLSVQFGAYASFLSFFGLSQLPAASSNFTGLVDYASAMVFELVTSAPVSAAAYPAADQISVRFLLANGSAAYNPLTAYPLFGQSQLELPWSTFVSEMDKFAIGDQADWCSACGNTAGVCAPASSAATTGSSSGSSAPSSTSSGMSLAVAGVIGAMVTLAVILGLEALVMLLGGLRLVSRKRLAASPASSLSSPAAAKA